MIAECFGAAFVTAQVAPCSDMTVVPCYVFFSSPFDDQQAQILQQLIVLKLTELQHSIGQFSQRLD